MCRNVSVALLLYVFGYSASRWNVENASGGGLGLRSASTEWIRGAECRYHRDGGVSLCVNGEATVYGRACNWTCLHRS